MNNIYPTQDPSRLVGASTAKNDTLSNVQHETISHFNELRGKLREMRERLHGPVVEKACGEAVPGPMGSIGAAMLTRSAVIELNALAGDILASL